MNANLLKSIVLVAIGVIAQFTLYLLRRGKAKKLEEIQKEEEEKQRLLEEAWNDSAPEAEPEMMILREFDPADFEEIKAYDGEIN